MNDNNSVKDISKQTTNKPKASGKPAVISVVVTKAPKKLKKEKKLTEKVKVVRDSFTMPRTDYDLIADLKQKALKSGLHVKKSELLRAGLQALAKLNDAQFKLAVNNLEKIKTGRPKKI